MSTYTGFTNFKKNSPVFLAHPVYFKVCLELVASFIALRPIVIVDLLGIQKLTDAFGLTSLFQGIACLLGTPLSGNTWPCKQIYSDNYNLPVKRTVCLLDYYSLRTSRCRPM